MDNQEKKLTKEELKEYISFIREVERKIDPVLSHRSWTNYSDRLYKMILWEEKDHRKGKPDDAPAPILSSGEATSFIYVTRLVRYAFDRHPAPDPASYHYTQESIFLSYSLAKAYGKDIRAALEGFDIARVFMYRYAELMAVTQ